MDQNFEIVRRIAVAMNKIDGTYYLSAKKLGINENMLAVLYALDDGNLHSQKQICEEWLIPKTTINTIVKELIEAGYITLLARGKTREKNIRLTDSGKAYTQKVMKSVYAAEQRAIEKTLQKFPSLFADALDFFADRLYEEFQKE